MVSVLQLCRKVVVFSRTHMLKILNYHIFNIISAVLNINKYERQCESLPLLVPYLHVFSNTEHCQHEKLKG